MTQFEILSSRKTDEFKVAEFDIHFLQSQLHVGEQFIVYMTHHPVECKILEITHHDQFVTLKCLMDWSIPWDDQFTGANVDTEAENVQNPLAISET